MLTHSFFIQTTSSGVHPQPPPTVFPMVETRNPDTSEPQCQPPAVVPPVVDRMEPHCVIKGRNRNSLLGCSGYGHPGRERSEMVNLTSPAVQTRG